MAGVCYHKEGIGSNFEHVVDHGIGQTIIRRIVAESGAVVNTQAIRGHEKQPALTILVHISDSAIDQAILWSIMNKGIFLGVGFHQGSYAQSSQEDEAFWRHT